MGFLKKKSASKLSSSGGDFSPAVSSNKSTSSVSRASFPVIAMPGECRDDTSVAIASIAPSQTTAHSLSSRIRSPDSESIIINSNLLLNTSSIKSPTAVRSDDYPRREESISSHATKQISNHGQAKSLVKSPVSRRPFKGTNEGKQQQQKSPSAKAQTAGAAKGKAYCESSPRSSKKKPAMTKYKIMINTKPRPSPRGSVSSDDSSDDSDDDETDGSYTDEDGLDTDGGEDTTMYTKDSEVSLGDEISRNLSMGSSTFEEGESIFGIMGKFGWNAKKGELTDDDDGTTSRDTLLSSDECDTIGQKESEHSGFMRKMDEFKARNLENQLIVQVFEHGNIEKLSLQELSYIPKPNKSTDIVVKVDCSTINLQDCMIRRGKWYEMQKLPYIPGSDFVGTIHDIGSEARKYSTLEVGDRVAALVPSGGNSKYVTIEYTKLIAVPVGVDSERALCLSSTYVPARQALDLGRKMNTPYTGANILVIGGNGPSGLATIELAMLEGANVFTTADERHHEYLTNLGAKCFPIDPAKWLPILTGKMDVVMDSVCLDGYESSNLALNSAGTLICTGMSAVYTQGAIPALFLKDVRDYKAAYYKATVQNFWANAVYFDRMERFAEAPNEYAQHFQYMCHIASKGTITPLVSTRVPLNKVASMQRAIELGDTTYGICVCAPWTTQVALKSPK